MNAWPSIRRSALHQWRGLPVHRREAIEWAIQIREANGWDGCTTGISQGGPEMTWPIWQVDHAPHGPLIELISVKVDAC